MRVLFALALPLALAQTTPQPTVPTPYPTITPAPESQCNYQDDDNGPFALDCLQAEFLAQGCSMRGTSYPNEVQEDSDGSKEVYNAMTWLEVQQSMAGLNAVDTTKCRGAPTPSPTMDPTADPTTLYPTPSPTLIPTHHTPAPTYPDDFRFVELASVTAATYADASEAATELSNACKAAGYARQYDATQYVIEFEMGDFTDYYTFVPEVNSSEGGQYHSICDMIEDPETYKPKWAANPEGPFWEVGSTETDKTILNTATKTPDGRSYAHWLDASGAGYGADSNANTLAAGGKSYTMRISSARSYSECVDRVDPTSAWTSRCASNGSNGQIWDKDNAVECNNSDGSINLKYALANNGFATCDEMCVYHPDYSNGDDASTNQGQFWYFQAGPNCWKPRAQYGSGEFQQCDPEHGSFEYDVQREYVQEVQARLCSEPCDFVNGWSYMSGSCYKVLAQPDYNAAAGATNWEKASAACVAEVTGGSLASIASEDENDSALVMCGGDPCYLGNDADNKGKAEGDWLDGTPLVWANWYGGYEGASGQADDEDFLTLQSDGTWMYDVATKSLAALCEVAANEDQDDNNKDTAYWCMENARANDDGHSLETDVYPEMDMDGSGFIDASNPGQLTLKIKVPKYFFNVGVSFENSTNDVAEYRYDYDYTGSSTQWTVTDNTDPEADGVGECDNAMLMELEVDWTVFNLGGAGGVQRLAQFKSDQSTTHQPQDGVTDFEGANYIFGATMRIEAQQPIRTEVNVDSDTFANRVATFERSVVTRAPFVIKFQKTVTITTDVDIVSTKFNYKTVAAIIQSIQYDTQYFEPPYAVIKMQIRTKSQYPYMFNTDPASIKLHPLIATGNDNVELDIVHLQDDRNCTFTNPDHMREGDICTQEWMLTVTPSANVCYATGEYTIEYEADCFTGKEVCYLPRDSSGDEIETVSFTFKVQTSKFCPTVADEVDLSGTLSVMGREAFQPSGDVEDATEGQFYLQGETIHLFAETQSTKAKIVNTRVVMVELVQNLDQLVMTGYNRVPYDERSVDLTVWTEDDNGRIADGTVRINDGSGVQSIDLMSDDDVFATGDTETGHTFSETEAGFKILLHAKAFPVNVDSMATKTLVATLGVDYEALDGVRRRRLLAVNSETDLRSRTTFNLRSFQPSLGTIKETDAATLSMELTLQRTAITRNNVRGFVQSFEDAVMTALQAESRDRVVEQQLVVEAIYSDDVPIWSRPSHGNLNAPKRRLLAAVNKKLRVDFTIVKGPMKTASVMDMLTIFDKQLRSPSSPLMRQPIFFGAVVHSCTVVETSNYRAPDMGRVKDSSSPREIESTRDTPMGAERQESSGSRALPILAALLLVALW